MIGLARPTTVRSAGTRHAGFSVFNRTRVPSTIRAAAPRSQRVRSAMTTRTPSPILLPSWPSYWLNGKRARCRVATAMPWDIVVRDGALIAWWGGHWRRFPRAVAGKGHAYRLHYASRLDRWCGWAVL